MNINFHSNVVIDAMAMLKMRDAAARNSDWSAYSPASSQLQSSHLHLRQSSPAAYTFSQHAPFSLPLAMASRRLAFSLNQALRSKQALRSIQPLKRNFATPVEPARTECTTLSNGLTVDFYFPILDCNGAFAMGSDVDRWRLD
jgi:hypothetical protein